MARASPTRLRIPPESSAGFFFPCLANPPFRAPGYTLRNLGLAVSLPSRRKAKRDIFGHGQRIEKRGALEDHAETAAHCEQIDVRSCL